MTDFGGSIGDGRRRAVVEGVTPLVDGGRFPVKRVAGDRVVVEADAFADGHDVVLATLRHRAPGGPWVEVPMEPLGNDRWRASFVVDEVGRHEYTVAAWTDHWVTWRADLVKRLDAGQDVAVDLKIGANLVDRAVRRAAADGAPRTPRRSNAGQHASARARPRAARSTTTSTHGCDGTPTATTS